MSNYPESVDAFTDKTAADNISSSDPNNAFAGIEAIQGLMGALGKPQSWSTTLMTLLRRYRSGLYIEKSGANLIVTAGEAILENTDATRYVFRRNPADVTLGAGNLDAGTLAVGTYYVYAKGGAAATTAPVIFSTDEYAPSAIGTIPYRKLGKFLNVAAGALAVTFCWDADSPVKREHSYDSDWVAYNGAATVPLVHNLGTTKIMACLYGATDAVGANMTLMGGNPAYYTAGQEMNMLINITTTEVTIKGGATIQAGVWDGSAWVAPSYARVILLAFE